MGDPLGWEALTQQEAEQDARVRRVREWQEDLRRVLDALAVTVRERDQARDALRRIAEGSTVIDYDTPSLAREIARAALAVGENATEGET